MAYRKYGKRSYGRRRKYKSTGSSVMAMAKTALRGVNFLRSVLNPERKFVDVDGGGGAFAVSNTGFVTYLSGIAQGDGVNSRDGNSVKTSDMLFRFAFTLDPAATVPCRVRMILFIDTDNLGTVPAVNDVLQTVSALSALERTTQSGGRFKILADRIMSLTLIKSSITGKIYKKLGHHLKYGGTTSAGADAREGAVFVLFISDQAANDPSVSYNSRIKYYDN